MPIAGLYPFTEKWHQQGTLWVYSDPHFHDKNLAAAIRNRPSAEEQIRLINSKVGRNDTLIILGDIGDIDCVRKLHGYKILIAGNHDAGLTNYKRETVRIKFDKDIYYSKSEVLESIMEQYPNWKYRISEGYDFHSPFQFWKAEVDNGLFDEVYGGPLMISPKLILSHEPVNVEWAFNIHGHIHFYKDTSNRGLNVCSDVIGYIPINMNKLMKSGALSNIESIHRATIDKATEKKKKRLK